MMIRSMESAFEQEGGKNPSGSVESEQTNDPNVATLMQYCVPSRKAEFISALTRLCEGESCLIFEIPQGCQHRI